MRCDCPWCARKRELLAMTEQEREAYFRKLERDRTIGNWTFWLLMAAGTALVVLIACVA